MNIQVNFNTFKSLGNVYSPTPSDNLRNFEAAEVLYKKNTHSINDSIIQTLSLQPVINSGSSITIPTIHYPENEFIRSLTFLVDTFKTESCYLSLIKVEI